MRRITLSLKYKTTKPDRIRQDEFPESSKNFEKINFWEKKYEYKKKL